MDPQDGAIFLSHPVMIVNVISVTIDLILILVLIFGQIFYRIYGPLRRPLLPKNWARPLTLSSVIFANILCQLLMVALAFPEHVNNVETFSKDETCLIVKLFLASELARNWYLVFISIHTLLATCTPSVLRRKIQFISWIIACIIVWIFSLCFTFFVLDGEYVSQLHANSSHAATCHINVENEAFKIVCIYAPLVCICLATLCSLYAAIGCSNRSDDTKWIHDQRITTVAFQIIITICFGLVSLIGDRVLDIAFYWLFILAAVLLKDIREIMLTFVCYTCCSRSRSLCKDDKRSVDEKMEMATTKRQNGTKDLESGEIEENNINDKRSADEEMEMPTIKCQNGTKVMESGRIEENNTDDKRSVDEEMEMPTIKRQNSTKDTESGGIEENNTEDTDKARIEIKTKERLEEEEREHYAHANKAKTINDENKTVNKITKFANETSGSKAGQTNEKKDFMQNKEEKKNVSRIPQKSKGISKRIRNKLKRRRSKKKKNAKDDDSTSNEDDAAVEDESVDTDDESEKSGDDDDNSDESCLIL